MSTFWRAFAGSLLITLLTVPFGTYLYFYGHLDTSLVTDINLIGILIVCTGSLLLFLNEAFRSFIGALFIYESQKANFLSERKLKRLANRPFVRLTSAKK